MPTERINRRSSIGRCHVTTKYGRTAPVGYYAPNEFGLYDVLGNVWEWTEDCWNDSYESKPVDGGASKSGTCEHRVVRGGSWYNPPKVLRSAFRERAVPEGRDSFRGFRVAREIRSDSAGVVDAPAVD